MMRQKEVFIKPAAWKFYQINLRTCAYQGGRNVSFSENVAFVLNKWSPLRKVMRQNLALLMILYLNISDIIALCNQKQLIKTKLKYFVFKVHAILLINGLRHRCIFARLVLNFPIWLFYRKPTVLSLEKGKIYKFYSIPICNNLSLYPVFHFIIGSFHLPE